MTYGSQGCECSVTGQIPSHFGCYTSTLNPSVEPSYVYYTQLAYVHLASFSYFQVAGHTTILFPALI